MASKYWAHSDWELVLVRGVLQGHSLVASMIAEECQTFVLQECHNGQGQQESLQSLHDDRGSRTVFDVQEFGVDEMEHSQDQW